VKEVREALRLQPDRAELHCLLGGLLAGNHLRGEAIIEFRKATQLKPDYSEAHYSLGLLLPEVGDWDGALAALRKAKSLAGSDPEFTSHLDMRIENFQKLSVLAPRLQGVLKGTDRPATPAEAVDFSRLAS
jgi:tetratricopeptide (TPR) repeat protein